MKKVNWDEIQDAQEFDNPAPGAYIAKICQVQDVEETEYIKIAWDFAEGEYMDSNRETYARAGFWPTVLMQSYKPKALPFFKAFKTAVEESNPGYHWNWDENTLKEKKIGILAREFEWLNKNSGKTSWLIELVNPHSVDDIRNGKFKMPERRPLKNQPVSAPAPGSFQPAGDADDDLPF